MRKFEVGDEVEVIGSGDNYGYTKDGSRGVIKTVSNDFCFIRFSKFTGGEPSYGTSFNIDTKCLKLVEAERKYKIGDMVTVINKDDGDYEKTGKVIRADESEHYQYKVDFPTGANIGNVFEAWELEPLTFRIGDEVRLKDNADPMFKSQSQGNIGIARKDGWSPDWIDVTWSHGETWGYPKKRLVKLKPGGKKMEKYDELKQRIEILGNGWTEEADNILWEIYDNGQNDHYHIIIGTGRNATLYVTSGLAELKGKELVSFMYSSQCEKNGAFKKALLWILSQSRFKNDEKDKKIEELEDRMDVIRDEIKELKG